MVRSSTLFLVAIAFCAGALFGFSYHHIVDEHHASAISEHLGHAPRAAPSETQWQRFEARLAALEGQQALAKLKLQPQGKQAAVKPEKRQQQLEETAVAARARPLHRESSGGSGGGGSGGVGPAGKCKGTRKPYHVVLTAQDSPYQAWQTRIMYYHFKKLQQSDPCTEMTGFTRMLNSDGARRDALMSEIPTTLVHALEHGSACHGTAEDTCDMGFPVMNRPHGVTQLLAQLDRGEHAIAEDYVLIAETDHVMLREPENRATPSKPVCFPFGYMNAKAAPLRGVVQRFVDDPDVVDPCGPSPVLIHLPQLRELTPEWLKMSFALKRDKEADKHFGWVLEMWGYTLAATKLGIRHLVWQQFQAEPSALWHSDLAGDPRIYHYTFGLEYTSDGMPVTGGVGDWSLDKRHFMSDYPPPRLDPPPRCAGKAAHALHSAFSEAIGGTPGWPQQQQFTKAKGTTGWGPGSTARIHMDDVMYHKQPVVQELVTQGPWTLNGRGPVLFFRLGRISTPWGSGTWGFEKTPGHGGAGHVVMHLGGCGEWFIDVSPGGMSFEARNGARTAVGELAEGGAAYGGRGGQIQTATAGEGGEGLGGKMVRRLLGSGPWAWTAVAPMGWLRGGVLHTPWGAGTWGPHPDNDGTILANFVGEVHHVTFDECNAFVSKRKSDGDRATGQMSLSPAAATCPELG